MDFRFRDWHQVPDPIYLFNSDRHLSTCVPFSIPLPRAKMCFLNYVQTNGAMGVNHKKTRSAVRDLNSCMTVGGTLRYSLTTFNDNLCLEERMIEFVETSLHRRVGKGNEVGIPGCFLLRPGRAPKYWFVADRPSKGPVFLSPPGGTAVGILATLTLKKRALSISCNGEIPYPTNSRSRLEVFKLAAPIGHSRGFCCASLYARHDLLCNNTSW